MKEALARAVILMTLRDVTNSVTAGLSVANEIPRTHVHRDTVAEG